MLNHDFNKFPHFEWIHEFSEIKTQANISNYAVLYEVHVKRKLPSKICRLIILWITTPPP